MDDIMEKLKRELSPSMDIDGFIFVLRDKGDYVKERLSEEVAKMLFSWVGCIGSEIDYVIMVKGKKKYVILNVEDYSLGIVFSEGVRLGFVHTRVLRIKELLEEILGKTKEREVEEIMKKWMMMPKEELSKFLIKPGEKYTLLPEIMRGKEDFKEDFDIAVYTMAMVNGKNTLNDILEKLEFLDKNKIIEMIYKGVKNGILDIVHVQDE
ncbi:MAG: hypothetical protein ACTSVF_02645 [Candidatus Asgardarchaeia archaeon]